MARGECLLDALLVFGQQIETRSLGEFKEIATRIAIAAGDLIEKLFEADFRPRHRTPSLALGHPDFFAERLLECLPNVGKHGALLARPTLRIW